MSPDLFLRAIDTERSLIKARMKADAARLTELDTAERVYASLAANGSLGALASMAATSGLPKPPSAPRPCQDPAQFFGSAMVSMEAQARLAERNPELITPMLVNSLARLREVTDRVSETHRHQLNRYLTANRPRKDAVTEFCITLLEDGTWRPTAAILNALTQHGIEVQAQNPPQRLSQILSTDDRFVNDRGRGWSLARLHPERREGGEGRLAPGSAL